MKIYGLAKFETECHGHGDYMQVLHLCGYLDKDWQSHYHPLFTTSFDACEYAAKK